jgi:hypothetical protein
MPLFIVVFEATVLVNEYGPPLSPDCKIIKLSPLLKLEVLNVKLSNELF